MPTNVSSRITWVEGSHPWHSVLIFPMKIFHVLFYSSLCYLVIINRVKKPLALCCLVDIALPWTCLFCSFQGSLFQFTVSEWLYWVFFFLSFVIQALLALLLFVSLLLCCVQVAWAVWFSLFALLLQWDEKLQHCWGGSGAEEPTNKRWQQLRRCKKVVKLE